MIKVVIACVTPSLVQLDWSKASPLDVVLTATVAVHILQQFSDRMHQIMFSSFEWKAASQWFSVSALPTLVDLRVLARLILHSRVLEYSLVRPVFSPNSNFQSLYSRMVAHRVPNKMSIRLWRPDEGHPDTIPGQLLDVLQSLPLPEDTHFSPCIPRSLSSCLSLVFVYISLQCLLIADDR